MPDALLYVIIAIAILVAIIIVLRLAGAGRNRDAAPPPPQARPEEGEGVADGMAAAVEDVVGEFTGVEAHPDVPGDTEVRRTEDGSGAVASTARGGAGDELTKIKGLGPKASAGLQAMGINRFEQIAGWTEADIQHVGAELGNMQSRIARDRWVEQAGLLARGEIAEFETRFGKLG